MSSHDFGAADFYGINVLGHFKDVPDISLASKCPLNFARGLDRPFPTKFLDKDHFHHTIPHHLAITEVHVHPKENYFSDW